MFVVFLSWRQSQTLKDVCHTHYQRVIFSLDINYLQKIIFNPILEVKGRISPSIRMCPSLASVWLCHSVSAVTAIWHVLARTSNEWGPRMPVLPIAPSQRAWVPPPSLGRNPPGRPASPRGPSASEVVSLSQNLGVCLWLVFGSVCEPIFCCSGSVG